MTKLNRLKEAEWGELKTIVMFGFGRQGRKIYESLKQDFNIVAIVDNSEKKQGTLVDNIEVMSFAEAISLLIKYKIVVTVQECNYQIIKKQLEKLGLIENVDFASSQQFITEWYYKFRQKAIVMKTDIMITSFCSLKCEGCMLHIPYWKHYFDVSLKEIEENLDYYFRIVDCVMDMDLIGGEPFLYKNLQELLEMIGERYREKIGYIGIITNGTIIPHVDILKMLYKYDIHVAISDYSDTLGLEYQNKVNRLCSMLDIYHVHYIRNSDIEWFDFGITRGTCRFDGKAAYQHMQLCNTVCHMLDDRKLYYCGVDYGAQMGGLISVDSKSYVDLADGKESMEKKREVLELILGNIHGVPEACRICGGFGVDNCKRIPTAAQIEER